MADDNSSTCSGTIRIVDTYPQCIEPSDGFVCSLPADSPEKATDFLEIIGSGGSLASGREMAGLGVNMPQIREQYEKLIRELVNEVDRRKRAGESSRKIAEWVVKERARIANKMRWKSGAGTRVLFEVRDWAEYGAGGRTLRNVENRYIRRGYRGEILNQQMIKGATSPNTGISNTAIKGARYLRHGGKVMVVFSLMTTTYVLLTALEEDLERVLYEEAGGYIGGSAGAGLGVGICLVFGIATSGWGLLACGFIGGVGGGAAGAYGGNRLYYSNNPDIDSRVQDTGVLDSSALIDELPAPMCVAPTTR